MKQFSPHSGEAPVSHDTYTQNVTFQDYSPGTVISTPSVMDSLRSEVTTNDLDLNNFFSRPVLIDRVSIPPGSPEGLVNSFDPWSLFFNNKRVINRISNFKLLRAKLHIRVLVNGSPFHFGRTIMCYTPLPNVDDVGRLLYADIINNSQKPHMYINPTTSQGGEMELPFIWHANAINIPAGEWDQLGSMDMYNLTTIRSVNGSTSPVDVSILAWATDVVLSCPTHANPIGIIPQSAEIGSDEYSNKTFSVRASNLATMAMKVSQAPVIGPYARATSMAASAMSAIAALFGYSRPVELERTLIVPKTISPMATSNSKDDAVKLSLDSKQEITVDPRAFGLNSTDEMEISHIAGRESYLTSFEWAPGNSPAPGELLWNCVVDPCIHKITSGGASPNLPKINMPAVCFAALPFQFWRGSMIFRFQICCSAMHKGRLRIVYDPELEVSWNDPTELSPEYNLGYSTVVDIAETQDFEVTVGWGQDTTYREHAQFETATTMYSTSPVAYDSSFNIYGNGVLGVYIVNSVTSPSTDVSPISVLVSVRAGPDFEVAAPTSKVLQRMRYRTWNDVPTPPGALLAEEDKDDVEPQSNEIEAPIGAVSGGEANTEEGGTHLDTLALTGDLTGPANMVHFGESIRSFRTLLKRYTHAEMLLPPGVILNPQNLGVIIQRPSMPLEPGFSSKSDPSSTVTTIVQTKPYLYGWLTPLRYITSGFVGWRGGIRWKVALGGCCDTYNGPVTVTRYDNCVPETRTKVFTPDNTSSYYSAFNVFFDESNTGDDGALIADTTIEPIIGFEVPYYSQYRFNYGRQLAGYTPANSTKFAPCFKVSYNLLRQTSGLPLRNVNMYAAIAEDFSLGMFIGAPVMFYEPIAPV
jgi:hypothetical protein